MEAYKCSLTFYTTFPDPLFRRLKRLSLTDDPTLRFFLFFSFLFFFFNTGGKSRLGDYSRMECHWDHAGHE